MYRSESKILCWRKKKWFLEPEPLFLQPLKFDNKEEDFQAFIKMYLISFNYISWGLPKSFSLSTQLVSWMKEKWEEGTVRVLKHSSSNSSLLLLNQDGENNWVKFTKFKCIIKLILMNEVQPLPLSWCFHHSKDFPYSIFSQFHFLTTGPANYRSAFCHSNFAIKSM